MSNAIANEIANYILNKKASVRKKGQVIYINKELSLDSLRKEVITLLSESSETSDELLIIQNSHLITLPALTHDFLFSGKPSSLNSELWKIKLYGNTQEIPLHRSMNFQNQPTIGGFFAIPECGLPLKGKYNQKTVLLKENNGEIELSIPEAVNIVLLSHNSYSIKVCSTTNNECLFELSLVDTNQSIECTVPIKGSHTLKLKIVDKVPFSNGITVSKIASIKPIAWASDLLFQPDSTTEIIEGFDNEQYCTSSIQSEELNLSRNLNYRQLSKGIPKDPYLKFFSEELVIHKHPEKQSFTVNTPIGLPIGYFIDQRIKRFDRQGCLFLAQPKDKEKPNKLLIGNIILEIHYA